MIYLQDLLSLMRYNFKICFRLSVVITVIMCFASQLLFDFSNMNTISVAQMGEIYLSTIGIIIFTQLAKNEERSQMNELIYTKKMPFIITFITRLLMALLLTILLVFLVIIIARLRGGKFDFLEITAGVSISCVYLGMIGLTIVNISGELAAGYIVSFGYYLFEIFTKGTYTGKFYLFSLMKDSFVQKISLLKVLIVLIVANMMIVKNKS